MSWLQVLLEFLRQFLPLVVIRDYQRGVRFVLGKARGPYAPGPYFSVPMVYEMESVVVVEQVVNLLNVAVRTKDGVCLTVSANVNYEVENAAHALCRVNDLDASMATEAMKYLHRLIRRATTDRLFTQQRKVERAIQDSLQRKVEGWGVRVIDVGLTDLVPTRFYRLYGDPMSRMAA